ncbi:MAG: phosphodiester glycosidase family protein, partial [Chitinophagales bacterium]
MKNISLKKLFVISFFVLGLVFVLSATNNQFYNFLYSKQKEKTVFVNKEIDFGSSIIKFRRVDFYLYKVDAEKEKMQLWLQNDTGKVHKNIGNLKKYLAQKDETLIFAMNAGMYLKNNMPQGLYKENNKQVAHLDTLTKGYGNFYMQPNGVFAFNDNESIIATTQDFEKMVSKYENATQSGPMLVIDGKIHHKFNKSSKSKYTRNGVGINDRGEVIFACSSIPVNLYHFADLFLNRLNCKNALYLDGAISKIYLPEINKFETS